MPNAKEIEIEMTQVIYKDNWLNSIFTERLTTVYKYEVTSTHLNFHYKYMNKIYY